MQSDDSAYEPLNWKTSTLLLVVSILFAMASEVGAIWGLWFKPSTHNYGIKKYSLPFMIAVPLVGCIAFRFSAKQWIANGKLSSPVAAQLNMIFANSAFLAYLCISTLVEVAF
jgi:hypothetical protein